MGAAAIVTEVNRMARAKEGLRGTVGALSIAPNVVNAVPREVRMTVELRSPSDDVREQAGRNLQAFARQAAQEAGLTCEISRSYHQRAQPSDKALSHLLEIAVQAAGCLGPALSSGATHDVSAMSDLCPIAMLFVRCRKGLSHVPEEFAQQDDLAKAVEALCNFFLS